MKSVEEIWRVVARRAPQSRRQLLKELDLFLKMLDNPHARTLTGRLGKESCDQKSAEELEAWVIDEFRQGSLNKLETADWLRLIYDLVSEFNLNGGKLFPTRLADVWRPEPSPFSPHSVALGRRVDKWRDALHAWILHGTADAGADDWLSAILLSSVVHGALLDSTKVNHFLGMLGRHESLILENGISKVLFSLPYQGLGNHHLQRWIIDPVTELLVWRYLRTSFTINSQQLTSKVGKFLASNGVKPKDRPSNLSDIISSAKTYWSERASSLDLQCASRNVVTHAIHGRSWARFQNITFAPRAERKLKEREPGQDMPEEFSIDDLLLLNPWLARSLEILALEDLAVIKSEVTELLKQQSPGDASVVYVGWLQEMLNGFSASKNSIKLSTIRRRYSAAAPRMCGMLGQINPADLDTASLEDYYSELTSGFDPIASVRDIAGGLRDFHAYLHQRFRKPLISNEAEVFGDENSLKPVDANLMSFDEYYLAQSWLDKQHKNKDETNICKIVLLLAFKAGLRRMEIFGLQKRDIHIIGDMVCLIRINDKRRLKTESSKRVAPLHAFLNRSEQNLLKSWLSKSQLDESGRPCSESQFDFLFPKFGQEKNTAWVVRITAIVCNAIREVTGDKSLFLHHLRHAFGTWTYLRLRAPDFPGIEHHFKESPATVHAIRTGARLRCLLMGRNATPSRSYAYHVSRLLGHSSPIVSLGHYVHCADLILGSLTLRECKYVPANVLTACSGLQKSAAYQNLTLSIENLVSAARKKYLKIDETTSQIITNTIKRGRKIKPPAHERKEWLTLKTIQLILKYAIGEGMLIPSISAELEVDPLRIKSILDSANKNGGLIGLQSAPTGELIEYPKQIRGKTENEFCKKLERKIAEMAIRAPVLLAEGIDLYLNHFDKQKHDTVFQDTKDTKTANKFLAFLSSLGLDQSEFTWVIRSFENNKNTLPDWANNLNTRWQPLSIKKINPKNRQGARSYEKWLGILPIDSAGLSVGMSVAKIMFLTKLSIESSPHVQ